MMVDIENICHSQTHTQVEKKSRNLYYLLRNMPAPDVNPCLGTGQRLSNPIPGDEVVISGIAGRYPECDNLYELTDSLMNKVDLITDDGRRWVTKNPGIPQRTGKLKNLEKFDAQFFGISDEAANDMNPGGRKLLEVAYEAIVDAANYI